MAFYKKIKDTVSSSTLPITDSALAAMCQEFINKISCYLALPEMPDIGVMKMIPDIGSIRIMPDVEILKMMQGIFKR
ncbi:uncharacterized protein TNCV_2464331 [Trichonephila clavipes]|nr:uncharacterized protein TNCV_2464331 [Trichonephila clavipes]